MGWTVRIEDENGSNIKSLSYEFTLSNVKMAFERNNFCLLKYLNPHGDTTFNSLMFEDLRKDFEILMGMLPSDKKQIQDVVELLDECDNRAHLYLKFYGD